MNKEEIYRFHKEEFENRNLAEHLAAHKPVKTEKFCGTQGLSGEVKALLKQYGEHPSFYD